MKPGLSVKKDLAASRPCMVISHFLHLTSPLLKRRVFPSLSFEGWFWRGEDPPFSFQWRRVTTYVASMTKEAIAAGMGVPGRAEG
jgi:hypothetical protein